MCPVLATWRRHDTHRQGEALLAPHTTPTHTRAHTRAHLHGSTPPHCMTRRHLRTCCPFASRTNGCTLPVPTGFLACGGDSTAHSPWSMALTLSTTCASHSSAWSASASAALLSSATTRNAQRKFDRHHQGRAAQLSPPTHTHTHMVSLTTTRHTSQGIPSHLHVCIQWRPGGSRHG